MNANNQIFWHLDIGAGREGSGELFLGGRKGVVDIGRNIDGATFDLWPHALCDGAFNQIKGLPRDRMQSLRPTKIVHPATAVADFVEDGFCRIEPIGQRLSQTHLAEHWGSLKA